MAAPSSDLRLVPARRLVPSPVDAVFRLAAGDRPLVAAGDSVVVGAPLAERVRDPRLEEHAVPLSVDPVPGARWTGTIRRGETKAPSGEYVFPWRSRWRIAIGEAGDLLETPFAGIVREVRPGVGITIRAAGRGIRGIVALGGPTRGRLQAGADGELRAGGLDVGSAGSILVVGSRVDAETLTRARAMGIRGIVVAGLSSKERRDYLASEARQRSALHKLPPFAVLILDGAARRPLGGAVLSVLGALTGREVAIIADPPMLVFDHPDLVVPDPPADLVRIRSGPLTGREGRLVEAIGPRRFAGRVHLEAGLVRLPDGTTAAVPLGDLERYY
jgi:antitoxin (DNA-binding transcriptional repressor) of toxin-antitoxin stability system